MTTSTSMIGRSFFVTLGVLAFAATSNAGPVYLYLAINPATTAGAGIPTIPRANGVGTFSVTSNKSGAGSFHLYALDSGTNSFGIAYFSIALNGTLSSVFNRSPIAAFDTTDDDGNSVGGGNAGFSLALLRSGVSPNPTVPIQGAQEIGSANRIGGLGKTASNFNNTPNMPAVPADGTRNWFTVTSGQWGNYATAYPGGDPSGLGNKWLLLGEGNYTGAAPTINYGAATTVLYYNSADFNSQERAFFIDDPEPASIVLLVTGLMVANLSGRQRKMRGR